MKSVHTSVLLNETIEGLNLDGKKNPTIVDGTFGGGGHSAEICKRYGSLRIIAIDEDTAALSRSKKKFENLDCEISFFDKNFRDIDEVLAGEKVDGIILDLGLSSDQLENSGRGFSFLRDEPLIMTMKENSPPESVTAHDIVNTWSEENLAKIIYGYGEEKFANKIARAITRERKKKNIETTLQLVEVIKSAVPGFYKRGKIHPATRTFQAIRMAVNDELGTLDEGLKKGFETLKEKGRLAVITFHSLEDRIVKRFYKAKESLQEGKIINKKVIVAPKDEIKNNPRSRSAKLRIIEKI